MLCADPSSSALAALGSSDAVDLYLDRCQVDTPHSLVQTVWRLVHERRSVPGLVVDFGAGDARFARYGSYSHYLGYEIDPSRCEAVRLPGSAKIINACAFSQEITSADLCIGNPPYVRNQDLPDGWRQNAASSIEKRTGMRVPGLANAWQYFFMLSLASTASDGLIAIVIPFEWVSRPSSAAMRDYIRGKGWDVDVYRLADNTFDGVLTTASITIVDKRESAGAWRYFREDGDGEFQRMKSPTGGRRALLPYQSSSKRVTYAKRGLSPGTQKYLTLTESERARLGLRISTDVVPCITSLKNIAPDVTALTFAEFNGRYVKAGKKCWLVRTDINPSRRLLAYFESVPEDGRNTSTCINRSVWWKFTMPEVPRALMATGYQIAPKIVLNSIGVVAVGSVCGIYTTSNKAANRIVRALRSLDYAGRVVAHSNGLRKLEINQINALLSTVDKNG